MNGEPKTWKSGPGIKDNVHPLKKASQMSKKYSKQHNTHVMENPVAVFIAEYFGVPIKEICRETKMDALGGDPFDPWVRLSFELEERFEFAMTDAAYQTGYLICETVGDVCTFVSRQKQQKKTDEWKEKTGKPVGCPF